MDRIQGDVGDEGESVAVGKNIRQRGGQTQSVTMSTDRDVASLLYSVERETQIIHREIAAVKSQLQSAVFVGMILFVVIVGLAIFFGDRQINSLSSRLHDVEIQLRSIERQMQRYSTPYVPPFGEQP